jgi:hypothetical protein
MAVLEGREAITLVLLGIIRVADADHRGLEQMHNGGQDLLTR